MSPASKSAETLGLAPMIALTGFMAAGKSTVGRALALLLHWHFVDLDCEIEARCQLPVHEIFAQHGEARFREWETEALRLVLTRASTPTVIALGGGTFVQPENAAALQHRRAHVVFLELALEELLHRCRAMSERCGQNPRPLAVDGEAFSAIYAQRLPHYRRARLVVQAQGKSAEQLAGEIAAQLQFAPPTNHKR
jgi:shikimate kinase